MLGGLLTVAVVAVALAGSVATGGPGPQLGPWDALATTGATDATGEVALGDAGRATEPPDATTRAPTDATTNGPADGTPLGPTTAPPLTCAPEGCAVWSATVAGGERRPTATAEDLLVVLEPTELRAVDVATGVDRWRRPAADLLGGDTTALLRADADGVVTATSARVTLLDLDGQVRWQETSSGWNVWRVELLPDHVVLLGSTPRGGSPFDRVVVLDRADGRELWTREMAALHLSDPDAGLVVDAGEGRISAHDPTDGELRWGLDRASPGTVTRMGAWLAAADDLGVHVLDPATGEVVTWLEGQVRDHLEVSGGTVLLQRVPDPRLARRVGVPATRLVGLDGRGRVRWQRSVETRETGRCCTRLLPTGPDTAALVSYDLTVRFDPRSGHDRRMPDADDGRTLRLGDDEVVVLDDGTVVFGDPDGLRLVPPGPDQPVVEVAGTDLEVLHADPPVVARGGDLVGLRVPGQG
jgi:hypothetical protein